MITQSLRNLRQSFQEKGFDLRFVGGCVRDNLLGLEPKDIDLCTNAFPNEQIEIYRANNIRYVETGIDHGTITVVLGDEVYEITSLRIDEETDGRHAKVAYTRDWNQDLARRDLTMNAISMDFDGNFNDPFEGRYHLFNGRVHFVGNAEDRVKEDYLRILRYFRFWQRFGNEFMDLNAHQAIERNVRGLEKISVERIWSEMFKILAGENPERILTQMDELNVFPYIRVRTSYRKDDLKRFSELTKNPITRFCAAFTSPLAILWTFSNSEKRLISYLTSDVFIVSSYRDMVMEYNRGVEKEFIIEKAILSEVEVSDISKFSNSEVPVFPVKGADLIENGVPAGKEIGITLSRMRNRWSENFTQTKEKLLFYEFGDCN